MATDLMKIQRIKLWAETKAPANFSISFVDSLQNQLATNGSLSEKQSKSLDNIITKFKIDDLETGHNPRSSYSRAH